MKIVANTASRKLANFLLFDLPTTNYVYQVSCLRNVNKSRKENNMTLRELLLTYAPEENQKIIAFYNDKDFIRKVVFETKGDKETKYFDDCLESKYRDNQIIFFYFENNILKICINQ